MHYATMATPLLLAQLLVITGLQGLFNPALAADRQLELTPQVGYRSGGSFKSPDNDETLDLDEGTSYSLIFNLDHAANTQWEFILSHHETELQQGPIFVGERQFDLTVDYFSAGGIYVWRDPKVEPFLGAGIGVTRLSPKSSQYDTETRALIQFVAGYKFWLTPHIGLRIEARAYGTLLDSDADIFCGNGACIARVESTGFGQLELNAGLAARF